MSFFDLLNERAKHTLLCVGLDPRAATAAEAKKECIHVINETQEYAAAYKPNAAFFEVFGDEGWAALRDVIKAVPSHIPVILDAKRGDIAATAEAYATSAFDHLGASAITVSPYMGVDSLKPFIKNKNHAVFALCKTSNPGSNELQTLPLASGKPLYEHLAYLAETSWNTNGNVGLVVGATDPNAIERVRKAAPSLWFLVPGVGAQGGDLVASLKAGLRKDGSGMLINASRGISASTSPRAAAKQLCEEIQAARSVTAAADAQLLATALLTSRCVRFGTFKLKSGLISPIYLDLRQLVTHPTVMRLVAKEYAKVLNKYSFDRLVGLPYAALPIATAVSLEMNRPLIYPRREAKAYGTKALIEGEYRKGDKVAIIDDLVTTGETKVEAIEKLKAAGLEVVAIVVLIDREMGATEYLGSRGYTFEAVTDLTKLLAQWKSTKAINDEQHDAVFKFMGKSSKI